MDFDGEKSSQLQILFSSFWYWTQSCETDELINLNKIKLSVILAI